MTARSFAVLILSHGRPRNVLTLASLRRSGYSGRTFLVVDDEDPTLEDYRELYGDAVRTFSKAEVAATFDVGGPEPDRRAVVYARNAAYGIARELGLDYFLELDDDYGSFLYRYVDVDGTIRGRTIRNLDGVIEATFDLLDATGAATVAWSQGGDHMGKLYLRVGVGLLRKAMNSFALRTDRPVTFLGRINEDVNTYVVEGARGRLFLTTMAVQLNQTATQGAEGGMSGLYLDAGTYVKSFYSVMYAPSCVRITTMGRHDRRLHHVVRWENAVPKIIGAEHRAPARSRRGARA